MLGTFIAYFRREGSSSSPLLSAKSVLAIWLAFGWVSKDTVQCPVLAESVVFPYLLVGNLSSARQGKLFGIQVMDQKPNDLENESHATMSASAQGTNCCGA